MCGDPIDGALHVHHQIPLARGGGNEIKNLRATHPWCNWAVGDLMPDDPSIPRRLKPALKRKNTGLCAACGASLEDRNVIAVFCKPCYEERHREAARASASRSYYAHHESNKVRSREAYAAKRDQKLAVSKIWARKNREKMNAYYKARYRAKHDEIRAKSRAYREKNRDEINRRKRELYHANKAIKRK